MAERDASGAANLLDGVAAELDHVTEPELADVGRLAISVVVERTKKGLDADLNPFAPYAPDYAAARAQLGLSITPDLTRSGQMLGALVPKVRAGAVEIEFADAIDATKAAANNDGVDTTTPRTSRSEDLSYGKRPRGQARKKTPAREFADVRAQAELERVGDAIGSAVATRVEKNLT
ncbi:MAG TPA: hypothetical protein VJ891_16930 [Casimicrobiaceae bacterium]|nr:hypothetical protein [Casimicrobiaceae bacterium]